MRYFLFLLLVSITFVTLANARPKEELFLQSSSVRTKIVRQDDIDMADFMRTTDGYVSFMYLLNRIIELEKK